MSEGEKPACTARKYNVMLATGICLEDTVPFLEVTPEGKETLHLHLQPEDMLNLLAKLHEIMATMLKHAPPNMIASRHFHETAQTVLACEIQEVRKAVADYEFEEAFKKAPGGSGTSTH
jgi:hypothetical protein